MSSIAVRPVLAVVCTLAVLSICSPVMAQRYGQNPAPSGFVPFADGPVAPGTTGSVGANGSSTGTANNGDFSLGNNSSLSFGTGLVTFRFDNNTSMNGGFYQLLSAFGNVDFIYQTMTGALVRVTSIVSDSAVVLTLDFGGSGSFGGDGSGNNTGSDTDVPDANPNDDNPNSDNNGTIDSSPGNPFAN